MARQLMPKAGIMMPYVVASREAAVVGVSTVDGRAGDILLDATYLTITKANTDFAKVSNTYTKTEVNNLLAPIISNAVIKTDPFINNNVPLRSGGGNGVTSVDLIKADQNNQIVIGDLAAGVQGVNIYSNGRMSVVDKDDAGQTRVSPLYSKRYRPEIADMPFAAIGNYTLDSQGKVIGVTKTGINSDIKEFTQPVVVPNAVQTNHAVNLYQLNSAIAASGGGGGATMNGVMNNFIGAVEWFNGSRAALPTGYIAADGQEESQTAPATVDLYTAVNAGLFNSVAEADWQSNPSLRGSFVKLSSTGKFRVPDLNGVQTNSIKSLFLRGSGTGLASGTVGQNAAPNITGLLAYHGSPTVLSTATGAFSPTSNISGAAIGNTITGYNSTQGADFKASRSSSAYGRADPTGAAATEVVPNNVTGIWIIRANGNFQAANTEFQVITSDSAIPANGTTVSGGKITSQYKAASVDQMQAQMWAEKITGQTKSKLVLSVANQTTPASRKNLTYDTDGNLVALGETLSATHRSSSAPALSFDGLYGANRLVPFNQEQMTVQGLGYLYPLISQKVYWAGHYGGAFTQATMCNADPTYCLAWTYEAGGNKMWQFNATNGNAYSPGTWQSASDIRHKSDIEIVPNALEAVKSWRGVTYDKKDGGREVGLIAQDVEKHCPEAVSTERREFSDGQVIEDFKFLNTAGASAAYHTEAIKILADMVENLTKRVEELEASR